jgi:Membrane-bound lytic murein transglycosylase
MLLDGPFGRARFHEKIGDTAGWATKSMRRLWFTILLAMLLLAPFTAAAPRKIGRALVTFYWLIDESSSRYRGKPTASLQDVNGKLIAMTTKRFRRDLIMEGSGQLRDGRTVVYERKRAGKNRFRVTSSKYGNSILGCPLIPYRTIAVDPRFIKLGSTVYIPQLKGAHLPDGTIHDGVFQADDRGHIHGPHSDFFAGVGPRAARPFTRKGYGSRSHVTAYVVDGSTPDECMRKR